MSLADAIGLSLDLQALPKRDSGLAGVARRGLRRTTFRSLLTGATTLADRRTVCSLVILVLATTHGTSILMKKGRRNDNKRREKEGIRGIIQYQRTS